MVYAIIIIAITRVKSMVFFVSTPCFLGKYLFYSSYEPHSNNQYLCVKQQYKARHKQEISSKFNIRYPLLWGINGQKNLVQTLRFFIRIYLHHLSS